MYTLFYRFHVALPVRTPINSEIIKLIIVLKKVGACGMSYVPIPGIWLYSSAGLGTS